MRKKYWIYIVASVFLAVFVLFAYLINISLNKKDRTELPDSSQAVEKFDESHYASYLDAQFYGDLEKIKESAVPNEKIYGGIVSHHFFAVNEIASFFRTLKGQKPKTIVIIGPNHFNVGKTDILVSKYPYETPWGNLYPDTENIKKLLDAKVLFQDEEPFKKEHSISALVGFIKYYLPDAKIIPIILKHNVDRENLDKLSEKLDEIMPDDSIVLASVDFSHHLNKTASEFHDQMSIAAIQNFDEERIYRSEIDSPASIYSLQQYLNFKKAKKFYYKNTSSAEIAKNNYTEDNTSYLFAYFAKGEINKNDAVTLLNFGDMMLGRDVGAFIEKGGNPFEKIKGTEGNFLKGADVISANLEGPITENKNCVKKAYSFRFVPQVADLIEKNNFNLVNMANNHAFDCKEDGFLDTKNNLIANSINYYGEQGAEKSYFTKKIGDKKVSFIGIDLTSRSNNMEEYYALANKLKSENNFLAVNIHWGFEYDLKQSQKQEEIAHKLIDNGVDLIIGHHPHVIQPVEIYKNKAIFYSLGNFIFDQIGQKMNEGIGVGAVFSNKSVKYYLFPFDIKKYQPVQLPAEQAEVFCSNYLKTMQNHNGCKFETRFD